MTQVNFNKVIINEKLFLDYLVRIPTVSPAIFDIAYDNALSQGTITLTPDAGNTSIEAIQAAIVAYSDDWQPPREYVYESKPLRRQVISGKDFVIGSAITFNGLHDDPNFVGVAFTSCAIAPYTVRVVNKNNQTVLITIEKQNINDEKTILLIDKSKLPTTASEFEIHVKPTINSVTLHSVQMIREL